MKHIYLILVHENTVQLKRLIKTLSDFKSDIYLQIDLKSNLLIFEEYRNIPRLFFIKNRIKITWGGFSQVQGMVNSFKEIIPYANKDQYVSVISGQDYPLMNDDGMKKFLCENNGKAFMEFFPIYTEWPEAIMRLENFHLTDFSFPGKFKIESLLNSFLPNRVPPKNFVYVGRSSWFTITVEHIIYIVEFLEMNRSFKRFFSLSWGCDEIIFQSILFNSKYKSQMSNNNLRYIDWTLGGARPKILSMKDADLIANSGKFFARKFDANFDSEILDWIDTNLLT